MAGEGTQISTFANTDDLLVLAADASIEGYAHLFKLGNQSSAGSTFDDGSGALGHNQILDFDEFPAVAATFVKFLKP